MKVVASINYEYMDFYHKEGPVLTAISVEETEPLKEELVYFN